MSEAKDRITRLTSGPKFHRGKKKKRTNQSVKITMDDERFAELLRKEKRPPVDMFGREVEPGALANYVSSSDNDSEEGIPLEAIPEPSTEEDPIITNDKNLRIAVKNLPWKSFTAKDIYSIFWKAAEDKSEDLVSVTVYMSKWGQEHPLNEEELPPNLEKEAQIAVWRKKEKQEMKRYFAIVVFKDADTADQVYAACNNYEIEVSGVYLDLSSVPDDMSFDEFPVRDTCSAMDEDWQIPEVEAACNTSSKPTEEWDENPEERKRAIAAAWEAESDDDRITEGLIGSGSEDEERPTKDAMKDLIKAIEEESENEEKDSDELHVEFVNHQEEEEHEAEDSAKDKKKEKKKLEKERPQADGETVKSILADERFSDLFDKPGYGVSAADPNFKKTPAMEQFMSEVSKRHRKVDRKKKQ